MKVAIPIIVAVFLGTAAVSDQAEIRAEFQVP